GTTVDNQHKFRSLFFHNHRFSLRRPLATGQNPQQTYPANFFRKKYPCSRHGLIFCPEVTQPRRFSLSIFSHPEKSDQTGCGASCACWDASTASAHRGDTANTGLANKCASLTSGQ